MEGGGRMVVTAVGPNSQQGQIFALLTERDEDVGECVSVCVCVCVCVCERLVCVPM